MEPRGSRESHASSPSLLACRGPTRNRWFIFHAHRNRFHTTAGGVRCLLRYFTEIRVSRHCGVVRGVKTVQFALRGAAFGPPTCAPACCQAVQQGVSSSALLAERWRPSGIEYVLETRPEREQICFGSGGQIFFCSRGHALLKNVSRRFLRRRNSPSSEPGLTCFTGVYFSLLCMFVHRLSQLVGRCAGGSAWLCSQVCGHLRSHQLESSP